MTISTTSVIKKLLIIFLVLAGVYFAKAFLMPLCIGGILATLFLPFCKWMEKKEVPRGLAALLCLFVLLISIAGVSALLGWQVSELTNDFSMIKQRASEAGNRIQEYIFDHLGISAEKQSQILTSEQPSLTGIMQMVAGSLARLFTNFVLVMAYVFLLLYYRTHIGHFLLKLTPLPQRKEMELVLHRVTHVSQQYLLGLTKMIVFLWIMYGIGFTLMGVKNPLFFAVLCGLLEIIPFIGNITGTTLTVAVAAVQGAGLPMLVGIVCTYGFVQFIQGWVLEPIILGPQVKINPFTTIVALVLGELIWGIPGIFLAIPMIAMIKIVCDHIESLKPYGFLIGETETGKRGPGLIKRIRSWTKKERPA